MTGDYWDETWNMWVGCDQVSRACRNCFAIKAGRIRMYNPNEAVAAAWRGTVTPRGTPMDWTGVVNEVTDRLDDPLRMVKPRRIYMTLTGDTFHSKATVDVLAQGLARIACTPRHTYLNTTKRPGIMKSRMNDPQLPELVHTYTEQLAGQHGATPWDGTWPLPNLHLGVSIEDQTTARQRLGYLADTLAAVRWVSVEPLFERVDLADWLGWLDWVVVGGESNSTSPLNPHWVRNLRDQCIAAGIPFWFKQWGEFLPCAVVDDAELYTGRAIVYPTGSRSAAVIRESGHTGTMRTAVTRALRPGDRTKGGVMLDASTFALKVGAKKAGRILDGRTWDQLPGQPLDAERPAHACV